MLFDGGEKMRKSTGIRNNHRFSEHGTAFGASDIKDVAELSQVRKAEVIFRCSKSIGQSGTVYEKQQLMLFTKLGNGSKLCLAIQTTVFRGLRKVDHAGLDGVGFVFVQGKVGKKSFQCFGREFSVLSL